MIKNDKEEYLESFKELYGRNPSKTELKAFIECMMAKKEI
jgi:phosphoribosylformylglycinamidine (FGAM) synthase-like enzyme